MIEVRFVRKCIWVLKNSSRPLTFNPKDIKSFEDFEAKEMLRTGYAVKVERPDENVDDLSSEESSSDDSDSDTGADITPERLRELYAGISRTDLQILGKDKVKLSNNMQTEAMREKLIEELEEHDIPFLEKLNGVE